MAEAGEMEDLQRSKVRVWVRLEERKAVDELEALSANSSWLTGSALYLWCLLSVLFIYSLDLLESDGSCVTRAPTPPPSF